MEEKLSTFDYPIRAKSIRNKPELKVRITQNALLKEYAAEVYRLTADVLAMREKNVFSSWGVASTKQDLRRTEWGQAWTHVDPDEEREGVDCGRKYN